MILLFFFPIEKLKIQNALGWDEIAESFTLFKSNQDIKRQWIIFFLKNEKQAAINF